MRRFFLGVPDRWNADLEIVLLSEVNRVDFHASNYPVIESIALHFRNVDMVMRFTSDFLDAVYEKLIKPAREFGYYYGNLSKAERSKMVRTSSASQYGGNDQKFSAACLTILSAIDEECARRECLGLK